MNRTIPTPSHSETDPTPTPPARQIEPLPGKSREIGGPAGPEPTRYGDWERRGRCIDF